MDPVVRSVAAAVAVAAMGVLIDFATGGVLGIALGDEDESDGRFSLNVASADDEGDGDEGGDNE